MNCNPEFLGMLAAICTTIAFLPQTIRVIRTRSVKDISLTMYIIFCIGVALWIVYGVFLESTPLILANVVTLALSSSILFLKILWMNNDN